MIDANLFAIGIIVAFVGGCVTTYFVMRNNQKWINLAFNIDDELRKRASETVEKLRRKVVI